MFVLSDKERLELKDVIVNMALVDIGFMMGDMKNIEKNWCKRLKKNEEIWKIENKPDSTRSGSKKAC